MIIVAYVWHICSTYSHAILLQHARLACRVVANLVKVVRTHVEGLWIGGTSRGGLLYRARCNIVQLLTNEVVIYQWFHDDWRWR